MKKLALVCGIAAVAAVTANAQETRHFSFSAGAGFTTPVWDAGSNLDMGWNVKASGGVNFNRYVGADLNVGYSSMGINSSTLANLGFGGGNVNIFSATVDPVVHLNTRGRFDVYLTGGGGYYRYYQNFTQPSLAIGTGFNPFFGFYQFAAPTNVVVASYSLNKPGVDAGMGVAFGSKWGGKFFAEAKFNRIFVGRDLYFDYVPVTFGFRW